MKRSIIALGLGLGWLGLGWAVPAEAKPSFSGTWVLDRQRSETRRLPDAEGAGQSDPEKKPAEAGAAAAETQEAASFDVTIVIEQSEAQLKLTRTVSEGADQRSNSTLFDLSGKESTETGPRGATVVSKASWDGDKLVLKSTRTRKARQKEMSIEQTQVWSLSEDGKTLTIEMSFKGPRREQKRKMVYAKAEADPKATPKSGKGSK
jgi:hypothetical protein